MYVRQKHIFGVNLDKISSVVQSQRLKNDKILIKNLNRFLCYGMAEGARKGGGF